MVAEVNTTRNASLTARAAWMVLAKTLAFMCSFAVPLLLVRRLDQTAFGLYKQVFLFVDSAILILPLGFPLSAYYFLPREQERQGQIISNLLLFCFGVGSLAALLLFLRPGWLATVFSNPELVHYAPLVGLIVLFWITSLLLDLIAIARQEVRLASIFIIASQLTRAILFISAVALYNSVRALLYAAIIHGALQTLILLIYLRTRVRDFWRSFEWPLMRTQLSYALPLGVAAVIFGLQWSLDNYFVSYHFGPAAYAVYAIGCFQLPLLGILTDAVASVMIPRVSLLEKNNERREIICLMASMMRKLSAVYFPLYVFLLVCGREFLITLFTRQYLSSWPIFAINITLIPLCIIASANDPVMRAFAQHRYFLLKARVILLLVLFLALWFGTARFGMVGAITIAISVNVIERLVVAFKVGRILGVRRGDVRLLKDMLKLGLASIMAGVFAAFTRTLLPGVKPLLVLVICGAVFTLVYAASILLLRILKADEYALMRKVSARLPRFGLWEPKSVER